MTQDTEMTLAKVKAWAKELNEQGIELKLRWDGGGDSGWVYFEIDGEQKETPETSFLVDWCYDVLDYGSWAGEFSASGEAVYDPKEEAFVGTDVYSTEEYQEIDSEDAIVFQVPTSIKVDGVEVSVEADGDEAIVTVDIRVTHGFKTPEYKTLEFELQESIQTAYYQVVNKCCKHGTYTPANCARLFTKDDMILEDNGQHWVMKWDDADINYWEEEDKEIVLSLNRGEDNE